MTPEAAAAALKRRATALRPQARQALDAIVTVGERAALLASSGSLSTAQMRRVGHPYATRRSMTGLAAAFINDQGGPFARSWGIRRSQPAASGYRASVFNRDPKARFLVGRTRPKSKMVLRAIDLLVRAQMQRIARRTLVAALRKALKTA